MPGPQAWSIDATLNDVIDPDIYYAEGQSPPTLNNAGRGVMAGVARMYADESGSLAAGGSANALTLSTNQGFVAADLARAFKLAFTVPAENTGPVMLNVDGTGAKPVFRREGLPVGPGDLRPGPFYCVRRAPGFGDSYVLVEPQLEAAGTIKEFGSEAAVPKGWVICDGRLLSRTDYSALFQAIGGFYGAGNGTTTFAVPDKRGRVGVGADNMGGTPANRLTGVGGVAGDVGSVGGGEAITLTVAQLAAHSHTGTAAAGGGTTATTTGAGGAHDHGGTTGNGGGHSHTGTSQSSGGHSHTGATDNGGSHNHGISYYLQSGYQGGSGGQATAVQSIKPNGTTPNSLGQTEADGVHGHNFTTNAVSGHQHGFTTDAAADHAHSISAVATHTHTVPATADHTHSLTINNAGSGAAHPNMPPAVVTVFAIKA